MSPAVSPVFDELMQFDEIQHTITRLHAPFTIIATVFTEIMSSQCTDVTKVKQQTNLKGTGGKKKITHTHHTLPSDTGYDS